MRIFALLGMTSTLAAAALPSLAMAQDTPAIDCEQFESILDDFERGPDYLYRVYTRDTDRFVVGTLDGWACVPIPMTMMRDGRIYLEEVVCTQAYDETAENGSLARTGKLYNKALQAFYACADSEILQEIPQKSDYPGMPGEAMLITYDRSFFDHRVLGKIGFFVQEDRSIVVLYVSFGFSPPDTTLP